MPTTPTREIAAHLSDLCKREKVKADEDALLLVARAGAGSMRDAVGYGPETGMRMTTRSSVPTVLVM